MDPVKIFPSRLDSNHPMIIEKDQKIRTKEETIQKLQSQLKLQENNFKSVIDQKRVVDSEQLNMEEFQMYKDQIESRMEKINNSKYVQDIAQQEIDMLWEEKMPVVKLKDEFGSIFRDMVADDEMFIRSNPQLDEIFTLY